MSWKTQEIRLMTRAASITEVTIPVITILPGGDSITNFHIYELDWSPSSEQFLVDGHLYETQTVGAPFNAPFFFIMNLAVGGTYPGTTSNSTIIASNTFPKEMQVDYVRVYEQTAPLAISVAPQVERKFVSELADQYCLPFASADKFPGWRQLD